jgi:hypothetical protein
MATPKLKENFRAAEPVSKTWYNDVAKRLNTPSAMEETLRQFPGFDASATQGLLHVSGVFQWVTVEEC